MGFDTMTPISNASLIGIRWERRSVGREGPNLYAFVRNAPLGNVDPYGLQAWNGCKCIATKVWGVPVTMEDIVSTVTWYYKLVTKAGAYVSSGSWYSTTGQHEEHSTEVRDAGATTTEDTGKSKENCNVQFE